MDVHRALEMLRKMLLVRRVEERISDGILTGEITCPCHLYIGQEAVAVGICVNLRIDDFVFSTHRGHGHYLAKGGNLHAMVSEMLCRQTGCSGGWGGSMHLIDVSAGLPGSSAIVAGTIPLAVGAALAFRSAHTNRVAVAFFGDGATNEGVLYESMNLAALLQLPVLFICENNLYSTHMAIGRCLADTDIAKKAAAFGLPAARVDGNDVIAVAQAGDAAINSARSGGGPTFIECLTYRWRGHVGPACDVDKGLRSQQELEHWMQRCPIKLLERRIIEHGLAATQELAQLARDVETEVSRVFALAREARAPMGATALASTTGDA